MNSSKRLYTLIVVGPILATLFGLVTVLLVGAASWPSARGVGGILLGTVVAMLVAAAIRWKVDWPTSIIASGLGAFVACYFTIASAEMLPAGSFEWMWKGGLFGAAFGIPVATFLSPLGLLGMRRTPG